MNLVRPSLSLLPVEDIAAELKSNKPNRNFMTREDKATDVENVAGIKAERIAISAEGHQRNTVENALNLNGKPASEYVTSEDGEKFLNVSTELSNTYSSEIRNLRDELYQLYAELSKNGLISNTIKYEGFVEAFKREHKLYESYICGIATAMAGSTRRLYINDLKQKHFFEEGKQFVIKQVDTDQEIIVTSLGVTAGGEVNFDIAVDFLESVDKVELHKSAGEYINSTFSFSEIKRSVSEQKERYYTQSDDTDSKYLTIKRPGTGYAVTFKVPRNLNCYQDPSIEEGIAGALSQFAVRAQPIGTPGGIRCHVVDANAITNNGILSPKFDNIQDAITKGYVLASSNVVYSNNVSKYENDVFFDFYGGVHHNYRNEVKGDSNFDQSEVDFRTYNVDGEEVNPNGEKYNPYETADKYPILKDVKYCFIVECLSANEESYWRLRFSYFNNNDYVDDLHRRNMSYVYKAIDTSGVAGNEKCIQIIDDIAKYDIMYTLVVKDIIDEQEVGKQSGLYTNRTVLPRPMDVTRARLTMRVNREGMWYMSSHNNDYTVFILAEENIGGSHSAADCRFRAGDTVIIGNTIATIKRCNSNEIETTTPVYIDERIVKYYTRNVYNKLTNSYEIQSRVPIYRLSYSPSISAKVVNWDNFNDISKTFEADSITTMPLKLELVSVIPDNFKTNSRVSDRLVFEAEFGTDESNKNLAANEFELQVKWTSPYTNKEINDYSDTTDRNFKELIGRVHDLSLTFDKHY